jgi:hypothetical protein
MKLSSLAVYVSGAFDRYILSVDGEKQGPVSVVERRVSKCLFTAPKESQILREITYFTGTEPRRRISAVTSVLVVAILIACAAMNFIYR